MSGALPPSSTISVIVPVLNEAKRIDGLLERLGRGGYGEIIVVDGGSEDGTPERVTAHPGVLLVRSDRGRALQMNAGAARSKGATLFFVHADATPPADAADWICRTMSRDGVVAGAFRLRTVADGAASWISPFLPVADVRSRYSGLPYGDQGIFVRADVFHRVGGYPRQPLMEDLQLSMTLRREGRIRIVPAVMTVSGRRFLQRPVFYTIVVNLFPLLYRLGVSPPRLVRWYGNPR